MTISIQTLMWLAPLGGGTAMGIVTAIMNYLDSKALKSPAVVKVWPAEMSVSEALKGYIASIAPSGRSGFASSEGPPPTFSTTEPEWDLELDPEPSATTETLTIANIKAHQVELTAALTRTLRELRLVRQDNQMILEKLNLLKEQKIENDLRPPQMLR